ncbi:MAG: bifunctional (p)ppGpp synthetase/guanosine-3',5'-bis(diphosphate) 3'-pyrophosphohydrolase [Myxococcales bacterium]|nr:bifunctional (p)ppGpp synthetase/guanosine-3',5'-bis(diphosphate) 3'-pyrophosphohydrolase [Myxococcales bacterium]
MSDAPRWSPEGYVRALHLAARWHHEQKVPGQDLPYLVHVVSVCAELLPAVTAEPVPRPDVAVQGALLHDILEDTALTFDALVTEMGPEVAHVVAALSKNPDLPKAERMPDSLRRILAQPPEAAMIKLADRITNLAPPPAFWSRDKRVAYREEAQLILRALGHASPLLAARLTERIDEYAAYL